MNRQPDGQELSAAALRQLGAAFAAAGAPMNPGMMMAAWRALSSGDQARARRGDPSVLGVLQRAAEDQIKLAQQAQPKLPSGARVVEETGLGPGARLEKSTGRPGSLWDQLKGSASNEDGSQRPNVRTDYTGLPGSTSWANPVFLQSIGLTPATAGSLAAMGFTNQAQIKAIANDTRTLGIDRIDKDKSAIALGGLKAYDRDNYRGHIQFFNGDYAKSYNHVLDLEGRFKNETDPTKRAALQKDLDAARKTHADLVTKQRGKIKDERALPHFDATEDLKRRAIEQKRTLGLDAARTSDAPVHANMSATDTRRQAEAGQVRNETIATRTDETRKTKLGLLDEDGPPANPGPSKQAAAAPQPTQPSPAAQPSGAAPSTANNKDQKKVAAADPQSKPKSAPVAGAKAPSATA